MIPAFRVALESLTWGGVRFVVIGGLAAQLLGAPIVTYDVDVCYDRRDDNLERLARVLDALEARPRGTSDDVPFVLDARTLRAGDSFTFETSVGPLDVLGTPSGTRRGYDDLIVNAEVLRLEGGLEIRVCALEDLIRMKSAAGRLKDRMMLEVLGALRDELERRPE